MSLAEPESFRESRPSLALRWLVKACLLPHSLESAAILAAF
jgi:hypothetical protein